MFLTASCRSDQLFLSVLRARSKTTPIAPRVILLKIFITSVNITQGRRTCEMYCVYLLLLLLLCFKKIYVRGSASNIWCFERRETDAVPKGEGVPGGWKTTWRITACRDWWPHTKKNAISDDIVRAAVQVFLPTTATAIIMILGIRQSPFIRA